MSTTELESRTAQQWPSTADLRNLPERLNDQQLAMVTELANSPLPPLPICDEGHFLKCLRTMLAVLPKRATDELSGELLANAYRRMLGHHTKAEINFMTEMVLTRCKWFPTIAECVEILGEWRRYDEHTEARSHARYLANSERRKRLIDDRPPYEPKPVSPEDEARAMQYLKSLGIDLTVTDDAKA